MALRLPELAHLSGAWSPEPALESPRAQRLCKYAMKWLVLLYLLTLLVALIITVSSATWKAFNILPKSFQIVQSPFKILPNRSKIASKMNQKSWTRSQSVPNTICSTCCQLLPIFGRPGAFQNRAKIAKNTKISKLKKHMLFNIFFLGFVLDFCPPKTIPKSRFVQCFFENADFVKIVIFLK